MTLEVSPSQTLSGSENGKGETVVSLKKPPEGG